MVEFHWDSTKRTSLFLQFTPWKKGREKGIPFRLQIDTFRPSDKGLPLDHVHSAGCLIKVFKCSPWPESPARPRPPLSSLVLTSPHSCRLLSPERRCSSPPFTLDTLGCSPVKDLNHKAPISETQQWLHRHRFSSYCRMLANFTGPDLLKLTCQDLIQICGAADGICFFNTLRARCWALPTRVPFPL
nr:upstream-binding protein 1-like isoform X2 [Pongo pygmaeus]